MSIQDTNTKLVQELVRFGFRARITSIDHLPELRDEIASRHNEGLLDEAFYQDRLGFFDFAPPNSLPDARSIIIAATAQPQIRLTFTVRGERVSFIVPPSWEDLTQPVKLMMDRILEPDGYRTAPASLPKKILAVRSGLARYGKNNITYVPEIGSLYILLAFFSDMPCAHDSWQEPEMMERCQNCSACQRACPTGAIGEDRFLLRAERCITLHNEKPSEVSFPDWIDLTWHNCLIGCMQCQRVCPENKGLTDNLEDGPVFSTEETALLLEHTSADQLPPETIAKLARWDLHEVVARNLQVLLDNLPEGSR